LATARITQKYLCAFFGEGNILNIVYNFAFVSSAAFTGFTSKRYYSQLTASKNQQLHPVLFLLTEVT